MKTIRLTLFTGIALSLLNCCTPEVLPEELPDEPQEVLPDDPEEEPVPDDEQEEPEINDPGWETACSAVENIRIGWNLGNTLDAYSAEEGRGDDWLYWETYWGQSRTTPELMQMFRQAGFGAIRVPVTWGIHISPDGTVYEEWMNRVHEIVDYVIDAGMYCIVNVHHDTGAGEGVWLYAGMEEYERERERFTSLWTQIAEEFKDYDHHLLFESYNEMLDTRRSWCFASFNEGYDSDFAADAYQAINSYAQSFVDAVRATGGNNIARNLIVNTYGACSGGGTWNDHLKDPLKEMKLPEDVLKDHLIFEVHSYPGIDNLASMRTEVDDMFDALHTHLALKGAPVIIGEWGTFTENPSPESKAEFIRYFVQKAKDYRMGTFYWMGLSDGVARSFPAFSDPECAEAILKAFYGEDYDPVLPTIDDFDCRYVTTFTSQWGELYLSPHSISLDQYDSVYLLLDSVPGAGDLAIKVYGEEGKEQYNHFATAEVEVKLDRNKVGDVSPRITLQYMKTGTYTIEVKRAALRRKDGTLETTSPRPFWGCEMSLHSSPL